MLDRLVLADRAVEHVALFGISGRARQRHLAKPDRFGGDQDALRVHAVQDILKTAAFLAETIFQGNFKILDEELVGIDRFAAHLLDLMNGDAAAVEVRYGQAEAVRWRSE